MSSPIAPAPMPGASTPGQNGDDPAAGNERTTEEARWAYARALGARLRAIRTQQRLSLHDVAVKSGGEWKAVVVGSYERGDRSVTVSRLSQLASFYGVPLSELLPPTAADPAPPAPSPEHLVVDLTTLASAPAEAGPFIGYVRALQRARHDYGNRLLTLRSSDISSLAAMFAMSRTDVRPTLAAWNVLAPDQPA